MKEYRNALISSIVIGLGLGILLAIVLLFMMIQRNFEVFTLGFYLEVFVVCVIPFCVFIVRKFGLSYPIVSLVMLVTSCLIGIIYAQIVGTSSAQYIEDSHLMKDILLLDIGFHSLMAIITGIIYYFYYRDLKGDLEE